MNQDRVTYILEGLVKEDPEYLVNGYVYVSLSSEVKMRSHTYARQTAFWLYKAATDGVSLNLSRGYSTEAFGDTADQIVLLQRKMSNNIEASSTSYLYNDNVRPVRCSMEYPRTWRSSTLRTT